MPNSQSRRNSPDKILPVSTELKVVMLTLVPEDQIVTRDISWLFNWKLCFSGFLMILTILILKQIFSKRKEGSVWSAFELFFLQKFSPEKSRVDRMLGICLAVFVFLLLSILSSGISTDLVIKEKPFMIDKLQDVFDPRASRYRPVWRILGQDLYTLFSKSPPQSLRGRVWQRALDFGLNKCLIPDDPPKIMESLWKYPQSPYVMFIKDLVALIFKETSCCSPTLTELKYKVHITNEAITKELFMFPYELKNDSCKAFKRAALERRSVTRSLLSEPELILKLIFLPLYRFQLLFEANFCNQAAIDSAVQDSLWLYEKPLDKWKCMGLIDPFDRPDWQVVTTDNITSLFTFFLVSLVVGAIVLVGEILFQKIDSKYHKGCEHRDMWGL